MLVGWRVDENSQEKTNPSAAAHHAGQNTRDELKHGEEREKNVITQFRNFISHTSKDGTPHHNVGETVC